MKENKYEMAELRKRGAKLQVTKCAALMRRFMAEEDRPKVLKFKEEMRVQFLIFEKIDEEIFGTLETIAEIEASGEFYAAATAEYLVALKEANAWLEANPVGIQEIVATSASVNGLHKVEEKEERVVKAIVSLKPSGEGTDANTESSTKNPVKQPQHANVAHQVQQPSNEMTKTVLSTIPTAHIKQAGVLTRENALEAGMKPLTSTGRPSAQSSTDTCELEENAVLEVSGDRSQEVIVESTEKVKALARMEAFGEKDEERSENENDVDKTQMTKAKSDYEKKDDDNEIDESEQTKEQERDNKRRYDARGKNEEKKEENKKKCSRCLGKDITLARLPEARRAAWKRIMRKNDVKVKWK